MAAQEAAAAEACRSMAELAMVRPLSWRQLAAHKSLAAAALVVETSHLQVALATAAAVLAGR